MVRSGSLFLVFLFLAALLGNEWNGGLAAPAFVGFDEQSKGFTPADLRADEKELADLDRQIDTKEKQLAELQMKASALRPLLGSGRLGSKSAGTHTERSGRARTDWRRSGPNKAGASKAARTNFGFGPQ
jgi:hypothetical protein